MSALGEIVRDHASGLPDHIGLERHSFDLERRQVGFGFDQPRLSGIRLAHLVPHVADFLREHHAPGEQVAFLSPPNVAGIGEVAQGQRQLHGGENYQSAYECAGLP